MVLIMEQIPLLSQLTVEQKDELISKLLIENSSLKVEIAQLKEEILLLKAHIDDLTRKLNSNSRNSHRPPSKDEFKKFKSGSKSKKKVGGQDGHTGKTLQMTMTPDLQIKHLVKRCPHCFLNLEDALALTWKRAQVFDIPELKIHVTEHLIEEKICPSCRMLCTAQLPDAIFFGAQYGKRILALITYLHTYQYLSSSRTKEFFEDLFGHTLSEGTVFGAQSRCFNNLEDFERLLKKKLINAPVGHCDETGLRAERKNCYLHVFSTNKSSLFSIQSKRGRQAMEEIGILPHFRGVVVHDHYSSYFIYGKNHALCNAHHLRELQSVFESTNHSWPLKMQNLLREIKKKKDMGQLCAKDIKAYSKQYDEILCLGYYEQKKMQKPILSRPKEINLLDRLRHYKRWTLLFMHQDDIPFDNNQAERDIRMMKLKMKISGCFRSKKWALVFCRIRSYISTIKKNGMDVFNSLVDVFDGLNPSFLSSIKFS